MAPSLSLNVASAPFGITAPDEDEFLLYFQVQNGISMLGFLRPNGEYGCTTALCLSFVFSNNNQAVKNADKFKGGPPSRESVGVNCGTAYKVPIEDGSYFTTFAPFKEIRRG